MIQQHLMKHDPPGNTPDVPTVAADCVLDSYNRGHALQTPHAGASYGPSAAHSGRKLVLGMGIAYRDLAERADTD